MINGRRIQNHPPRKLTLAKVIIFMIIAAVVILPVLRLVNGTTDAIKDAQMEQGN